MEGLGCIKLQAIRRLLTGLDIEICSACANAEQDPEGRLIKAFNGQPRGGEWDEEWLIELLLVDCFLCTPEEGGVFVLAGGLNYSGRGKLILNLHSQRLQYKYIKEQIESKHDDESLQGGRKNIFRETH
ncbi:unnamed protein product [Natator depressus]